MSSGDNLFGLVGDFSKPALQEPELKITTSVGLEAMLSVVAHYFNSGIHGR